MPCTYILIAARNITKNLYAFERNGDRKIILICVVYATSMQTTMCDWPTDVETALSKWWACSHRRPSNSNGNSRQQYLEVQMVHNNSYRFETEKCLSCATASEKKTKRKKKMNQTTTTRSKQRKNKMKTWRCIHDTDMRSIYWRPTCSSIQHHQIH